ncbi:Uncharacterised protein [Bordetella ansorpii]|uniref:Uncharacterized protein n=1 Tax=Bordetella ansorpii TaxID=288768 RepID=A0A157RFL2_9BORD|nr:Uncharacterised protein [Bordetella ansorpii]
MTLLETDGGIRLFVRKSSSARRNSWNRGNAVNSDSATASIGTMASTVVKVRLEATCSSRSSPVRSAAKRVARPMRASQVWRRERGEGASVWTPGAGSA